MEEKIRSIVSSALQDLGASSVSFTIERPAEFAHGDYAVNAAMVVAKELGKAPREIAAVLVEKLTNELGDLASSVEAAGPGFVNITLSKGAVTAVLSVAKGSAWGSNDTNTGKKVMIEYGNPNQFKEMHIGHLMSGIIGEAASRLIASTGAHVLRDTFGGDIGPHVAKALWALTKEGVTDVASAHEIGKAYVRGETAYSESEEAKAEIDAFNTRLYDIVSLQNDPASLSEEDRGILSLWLKGREVCVEEFMRTFALLGTKHDYSFYDSDTTAGGLDAVNEGLEKGIFERSEGAIIYPGEKKGLHTLVFVTSRGTPTYETKDIGLAFLKEARVQTDEIIILTSIEQIGHFKVFLAALEDIAPLLAKKTRHISHGLLRFATGKMSSRKGNVITATGFIEEIIEKASEKNADPLIAQQVALGAVKYMILRQSPGADIIFDSEKSLSLEGDSGPYLQYATVRAKSILAQAEGKERGFNGGIGIPYQIERLIMHFPEVVARASEGLAPQLLTAYLTELAGAWNSFYAAERILGDEHESYKLAVAEAFVTTMTNGLTLLSIPVPEKM